MDDGDLVCEDGTGRPLHPRRFSRATKRLVAAAGLPAKTRLHDLRHGVAVLLALEGVPLVAVAELLGHSRPSFTAGVYQHVVSEMRSAAADAVERRLGDDTLARRLQEGAKGP